MRHHRQQEAKEQAGVENKLHHILQTHGKQLCRDWLKVILVSLLIFLLLLYLLTSSHWLICTPTLSSALPQHTSVTEGRGKTFLFLYFTPRWIRNTFTLEICIQTNKRKLTEVILHYWKAFPTCFVFFLFVILYPSALFLSSSSQLCAHAPPLHPVIPQLAVILSC